MAMFSAAPAQAYEGPWCAVETIGRDAVRETCHFRDFESCRREVVSGNRGFCRNNPRWSGYYARPAVKRKHMRKRHRR
jgi:hypothetical protein